MSDLRMRVNNVTNVLSERGLCEVYSDCRRLELTGAAMYEGVRVARQRRQLHID